MKKWIASIWFFGFWATFTILSGIDGLFIGKMTLHHPYLFIGLLAISATVLSIVGALSKLDLDNRKYPMEMKVSKEEKEIVESMRKGK